jgi:hypothetical protein
LVSDAPAEYLARQAPDEGTELMNLVCAELGAAFCGKASGDFTRRRGVCRFNPPVPAWVSADPSLWSKVTR